MCQRAVWLDHGTVRTEGPTAEVVRAYLDSVDAALIEASKPPGELADGEPAAGASTGAPASARPGGQRTPKRLARPALDAAIVIRDISVTDANGRPCADFDVGDALRARVRCFAARPVQDVQCTLTVRGDYGPLFAASSQVYAAWTQGGHEVECVFEQLPLLPSLYRLEVELIHADAPTWSLPRAVAAFRVTTDLAEYGSDSVVGATKSRGGFLAVAYGWRLHTPEGEQVLPGLRVPRNICASRPP
jgi:hypothetical protein